jgi:hypothetical protein
MTQAALASLESFIAAVLADPDDEVGISLHELANSPKGSGPAMLAEACVLLDEVGRGVAAGDAGPDKAIVYLKFRLPGSKDLMVWDERIWNRLNADGASIEVSKRGEAFYWGVWESHHETVRLPLDAYSHLQAIFRRHKGSYDGKPWRKYDNEIFVFAPPA